jgi:uncharacterized protein
LLVEGSRIFGLSPAWASEVDAALDDGDPAGLDRVLARAGLAGTVTVPERSPNPPLRSLSLAVAQACNLACTYCYAQGGAFGGEPKQMSRAVARAAVDRLIGGAGPGDHVHLAFLGGEPLANRDVLRDAAEYAIGLGARRGVTVGLAVTTNGTLLDETDRAFFEAFGFAVTISLDGMGPVNDRLRVTRGGAGTYDRVLENVGPWLKVQRRAQVSVRVTVTPSNLDLPKTLDYFIGLGFHHVGFSPMLASPTSRDELDQDGLEKMLRAMIACGERFEHAVVVGQRYPFLNMVNAMRELHRGSARPLPCGAGAGYLGVSAEGELFACHRFVGDEAGRMGNLDLGIDPARQADWVRGRAVDRQDPCRSCWARYLCGGGCHHEVLRRGRVACDFIRGWLHYALQAYVRLLSARPDYFEAPR